MKKSAALFALFACVSAVQAQEITLGDLPARIIAASPDVMVLGEVHDNPDHHAAQAEAVGVLRPKALVFEMLSPEQAARATPEARKDAVALGAALGWEASGWPDFAMYAPIFMAAPDARIYGAARSREEVRRAMKEPVAQVFGPGAAAYGLDQDYPEQEQAALEDEVQADHCGALPVPILPGMVAAQRLRDADFADATLRALRETGGPVALITGSGHARTDRAVPAMIRRAAPDVDVLALGQTEAPAQAGQPYDIWIVTPPVDRPDPCAAFQ